MDILENPDELAKILFQVSNFATTQYEKDFDPTEFTQFANNYAALPVVLVIVYMSFIHFGSIIMAKCKEFDLRLTLAAWNAFLSFFSFLGMFRTVPFLLASVLSRPYYETICLSPTLEGGYGKGPVGFWVMLFIFSKVPELIDTVFIVLRKKKLIFLHWYHHVTVLLYCWHAFSTLAGTGLYFVAMNFSVHAVMYGYYCLVALHALPRSFPTVLITVAQITQMFVGTGVCMSAWFYKLSNQACFNETSNLVAGGLMYGSYLYLFCDFAFGRYLRKESKAPKKVQ